MMTLSALTSEHIYLSLLGYGIVLLVLISLAAAFKVLPKILGSVTYVWKEAHKIREGFAQTPSPSKPDVLTGEETAAIAMALHLYLYQRHDDEDLRFTVKSIKRQYSPWSSKIYGVQSQQSPRHNTFRS